MFFSFFLHPFSSASYSSSSSPSFPLPPPPGACKVVHQDKEEEAELAPTSPPSCSPESPPSTSSFQTSTAGTPVTPSAPSPVEGPGTSECVVCMETGSQVIFLPCGHVCCCQLCSGALRSCPLCRSSITQHVRLYYG
ncbi:E3 ubiquitin-protein ligase LRSAM1-like [Pseudoliparis swirei]|uniref:E3 ubiquitin-protein ligase LRSAM1-like n=1 Tax=Pseudoliparis swirei TaxID=2059687 RepID=UPI0024BDFFBF|nr:E3 ubiquitin-protein ligase LRSAM1-like [Pseudoliparis swirei]